MSRYIDAEEAKSLIDNDCLEQVYYSKQDAKDCIDCVDTADVTPTRYARWKGAGMGDYYCSLCCETYSGSSEWNYCPNCGARMHYEKAKVEE